ncbi:MAG TPA: PEP-CTERM sorting domain-containing protein [Telluria sp.]|jgi:probable HAF family extracellular repeat protein
MLSRSTLLALLCAPLAAVAAPRYTITALPVGTSPTAINSAGQIVGDMQVGGERRGFVWSNGTLVQIGTLGGPASSAMAINASGVIAGYASLPGGGPGAFSYAGGALTPLQVFDATASYGYAINDSGHVAGGYYTEAGGWRAFIQQAGNSVDLGTLGGDYTWANGINNAGHAVGMSALDNTSPWLSHAFYYADGVMTDLGTMLDASLSEATAINDLDQIAGHGWVYGSHHAFLYQNGVMQDLGTLGGRRSFAYDINNLGQVVGNSNDPDDFDYFAYVYDHGMMTDLNTLIDPASGWTLHDAHGINDSGQIAAYGCRGDECAALLLELAAVPEPAAWLMVLTGLGLLGLRRKV